MSMLISLSNRNLNSGNMVEVMIETNGCHGQDNEINFLEHVQFIFTLNYSKRGAISIASVSPSGQYFLILLSVSKLGAK